MSHFPCSLPLISGAVLFASAAHEGLRYPASNKLCYLVYNLRLKLKKRKEKKERRKKKNEFPLALGTSSYWKYPLLETSEVVSKQGFIGPRAAAELF